MEDGEKGVKLGDVGGAIEILHSEWSICGSMNVKF